MKITKIIEEAGFPVYENGGYECNAVDQFIDEVEAAALELEAELQMSRDSESESAALREEVRISKEKNELLQSDVERLGSEVRELAASNKALREDLESQAGGSDSSPDPRLQQELASLRNQKEIDADQISRADLYAQGLESNIQELNARIEELSSENKELLSYTQRFAAKESGRLPYVPPSNEPQHASESIPAEEDEETDKPLYQRKRLVRQPRHDL